MRSIVLLAVTVVSLTLILQKGAYSENNYSLSKVNYRNAIVKIESLPVLSEPKKNGRVVLTIEKGKTVNIQYQLTTEDACWCAISKYEDDVLIGFVDCDLLQFNKLSESNYIEISDQQIDSSQEQYVKSPKKLLPAVRPKTKQNKNWPALLDAAWQGKTNTIQALIKGGVDINARDKESGLTALMVAAVFGKTEAVNLLLSAGAQVNAKDNYGWSAIMIAADGGNLSTVKALLKRGANINIKEANGFTASDLAKRKGHADIVKLLRTTRE